MTNGWFVKNTPYYKNNLFNINIFITHHTHMNNKEFKLSFNHPVKEIYPGISSDEIEYIFEKIRNETNYKFGSIPTDVFLKYYTDYLTNKTCYEEKK